VLVKRFGALLDPIGFDEYSFAPTRPFIRGYSAALLDAWASVEPEYGGQVKGPGTPPATRD
jgi:hypothetical protein